MVIVIAADETVDAAAVFESLTYRIAVPVSVTVTEQENLPLVVTAVHPAFRPVKAEFWYVPAIAVSEEYR
jgi:hypothetical protein